MSNEGKEVLNKRIILTCAELSGNISKLTADQDSHLQLFKIIGDNLRPLLGELPGSALIPELKGLSLSNITNVYTDFFNKIISLHFKSNNFSHLSDLLYKTLNLEQEPFLKQQAITQAKQCVNNLVVKKFKLYHDRLSGLKKDLDITLFSNIIDDAVGLLSQLIEVHFIKEHCFAECAQIIPNLIAQGIVVFLESGMLLYGAEPNNAEVILKKYNELIDYLKKLTIDVNNNHQELPFNSDRIDLCIQRLQWAKVEIFVHSQHEKTLAASHAAATKIPPQLLKTIADNKEKLSSDNADVKESRDAIWTFLGEICKDEDSMKLRRTFFEETGSDVSDSSREFKTALGLITLEIGRLNASESLEKEIGPLSKKLQEVYTAIKKLSGHAEILAAAQLLYSSLFAKIAEILLIPYSVEIPPPGVNLEKQVTDSIARLDRIYGQIVSNDEGVINALKNGLAVNFIQLFEKNIKANVSQEKNLVTSEFFQEITEAAASLLKQISTSSFVERYCKTEFKIFRVMPSIVKHGLSLFMERDAAKYSNKNDPTLLLGRCRSLIKSIEHMERTFIALSGQNESDLSMAELKLKVAWFMVEQILLFSDKGKKSIESSLMNIVREEQRKLTGFSLSDLKRSEGELIKLLGSIKKQRNNIVALIDDYFAVFLEQATVEDSSESTVQTQGNIFKERFVMANDNLEVNNNLEAQSGLKLEIEKFVSEVVFSDKVPAKDFYNHFSTLSTYKSYATSAEGGHDLQAIQAINDAGTKLVQMIADSYIADPKNYVEGFKEFSAYCLELLQVDGNATQVHKMIRDGFLSVYTNKKIDIAETAKAIGRTMTTDLPGGVLKLEEVINTARSFAKAINYYTYQLRQNKSLGVALAYSYIDAVNIAIVTAENNNPQWNADSVNFLLQRVKGYDADMHDSIGMGILLLKLHWLEIKYRLDEYYNNAPTQPAYNSSFFSKIKEKTTTAVMDVRKNYGTTYTDATTHIKKALVDLGAKDPSQFSYEELTKFKQEFDLFVMNLPHKEGILQGMTLGASK